MVSERPFEKFQQKDFAAIFAVVHSMLSANGRVKCVMADTTLLCGAVVGDLGPCRNSFKKANLEATFT
jgi:hypothetical protein